MTLDDLAANAGVLPISETGLRRVLDIIDQNRGLEPEGYVDAARYAIRAVAALLPSNEFELMELANVCEIHQDVTAGFFYEVVEALGDYDGEIGASTMRRLIGLIDDGVRPAFAAQHLEIPEAEFLVVEELLDTERYWGSRILDKLHVLILDGGSLRQICKTLNVSAWTAFRLRRLARRSMVYR